MASNRVTPSPDGERYPLERMDMNTPERQQLYDPEEYERQQQGRQRERDLQLLQHKKKDIVIGGKTWLMNFLIWKNLHLITRIVLSLKTSFFIFIFHNI